MSENPADKRKEPRFEVETHVPAVWGNHQDPVFCGVSDISKGGLFLQMEDPPPVETQIVVGPDTHAARGRVVFCLPPSQAHTLQRKAGVGIQLDRSIDPDSFLLRCREAEAAARAKAAIADFDLDDFDLDELAPPAFDSSIPLPGATTSSAPIPLPRAPTQTPDAEPIALPASRPSSQAIPLPTSKSSLAAIPLPTSKSAAAAIPLPTSKSAAARETSIDIPMSDTPWPTVPNAPTAPMVTPPPVPEESRVIPQAPPGVRPAGAAPMLNKEAVKRARKQVVAEERRADSGKFKAPPRTGGGDDDGGFKSPPRTGADGRADSGKFKSPPRTGADGRADSGRFRLPHTPAPVDGGAEVVVVEGVSGQGVLTQALSLDGYTPLVARHGLEALALTLRRKPLLVVVGAGAARLSGAQLVRALRQRGEFAGVQIVLVDGGKDLPPDGCVLWQKAPTDLQTARRLIDEATGLVAHVAGPGGADDARDIALAIVELGKKLHEEGAVDDAVSALRYAAELAPTVSAHTLALARVLLGSPEAAERAEGAGLVERVSRQDPRNADAAFLRAVSLEQRGQADNAKQALQRALLLVPGHEEATAGLIALNNNRPLLEIDAPQDDGPKKKGLFGWLQGLFKKKKDDVDDHAD